MLGKLINVRHRHIKVKMLVEIFYCFNLILILSLIFLNLINLIFSHKQKRYVYIDILHYIDFYLNKFMLKELLITVKKIKEGIKMKNIFIKVKEFYKSYKKKIITISVGGILIIIFIIGTVTGVIYSKAKGNIKYTQEQLQQIAIGKAPGEVIGVEKELNFEEAVYEYEFKIKDKENMLQVVKLDSKDGVILRVGNEENKDRHENNKDKHENNRKDVESNDEE